YTGVTNVIGTKLVLFATGKNTGTTGYVVTQGGTLQLDNSVGALGNRLGVGSFVELDGGNLQFNGATGAGGENIAALNFGNAGNGTTGTIFGTDTVDLGASNNTFNVGTINRTVGSTVKFQGTNFGTGNNLTPGAFGVGAGLVNGILPYANFLAATSSFVTDVTPGTT